MLAAGFAAIAGVVEVRGEVWGDTSTLTALHERVGSEGQDAFTAIDNLTDLSRLAIAAAAALIGLLLTRRMTRAVLFALGVGGVWVLNPMLKNLFERPRPDLWPTAVSVSEFSFPSGHAANTAALAAALLLALPPGRWRLVTAVLGLAGLVVVAFSQLALGVHYPSDILAGWLLAGAWVAALRLVSLRHGRQIPG